MSEKKIEELLSKAPSPRPPATLLERLEAQMELPEPTASCSPGKLPSRLRFWFPALSLAASAAILAIAGVIFFSPSPVAYSFGKTVEALRNTQSVLIVHKFRHGPHQPLKEAALREGTTNYHPANPFATVEIRSQMRNGREMSHIHGNGREQIRNGPLGLTVNTETGERDFFLLGSGPRAESSFLHPEDWFLELVEQQRKGEVEFEILDKIDSAGNMQIVIRHRALEDDELIRLWVNVKTYLPIRFQVLSTGFPEFGAEVLMNEFELFDYGVDFDDALFSIEPTDAELEKFGLTRDEIGDLPVGSTSIEIEGDAGVGVRGSVSDGRGRREFAGRFPLRLIEAPEGDMHIDLRTENGERARFEVRIGGGHFMTQTERIVIFMSGDGRTRGISTVPPEVDDIEAFMMRNR
jgi:hypothetical protein